MKKLPLLLSAALTIIVATSANAQKNWLVKGNAGIDSTINFLGTTDKAPLIFRTNNVEKMRILKSGKTGIGTSKPEAKLNVVSSDFVSLSTPGILMLGSVTGSNMAIDHNVLQSRFNGAASDIYLNYYGGTAYLGPFGGVAAYSGGILITSGIAGIAGSTNSSYALNVNATSSLGGISITDPVDNTAISFTKSGLNYGAIFSKTNTSSGVETINSYNAGSGAGIYASSADGYGVYGVSNSSSGVYGQASITGGSNSVGVRGFGNYGIYATTANNTSYYAGYFVGDVLSTTGVYATSDQKLKENINDVTSAMDIINRLHPKFYTFRNDGDYKLMNLPKGTHYGLIAQDVEKVLPNLVKDSKFDASLAQARLPRKSGEGEPKASSQSEKSKEAIDFKTLNYTELIPIIIKGMQEQEEVINRQQQQIDELKQLVQTIASSQSSAVKSTAAGSYLMQNNPNPFNTSTVIRFNIPSGINQAQLVVYNANGTAVKSFAVNNSGMGQVTIDAGSLTSGQYKYSLLIDGKQVDSKSMVLTK